MINGVRRVEVRPVDPAWKAPLTLVPSYPDLPMEKVYTTTPHTDIPAVFRHQRGKGRVVYFPMDIDRTFWEVLSPDHLALLRNAILWAAAVVEPASNNGPGLVDIAYWRQPKSLAVHLVNMTNPMAMKGPFRELIPIGPLTLEAELPRDVKPTKVQLLTAGGQADWSVTNGRLRVRIPRLELHEVVAVDI